MTFQPSYKLDIQATIKGHCWILSISLAMGMPGFIIVGKIEHIPTLINQNLRTHLLSNSLCDVINFSD